nr:E3 ubiquitin-protein ligase HERC2-like [Pongo pygmaeus]
MFFSHVIFSQTADVNELKECLSVLVKEQQALAIQSATTTLSPVTQAEAGNLGALFHCLEPFFRRMSKLSGKAAAFLYLLWTKKGMFTERQAPKGQKHPPAGPALGPGHPAGAGCAERHAEVRAAADWERFGEAALLPMLSAILLLLQLWDSGAQEMENERSTAQGTSAPLLPLLQRFQSIICRKDTPHSEGDMHLLSGPLSPIESFLRYLPQDNELAIDLRQMVVVVMAHLDRLATPCRCLHCVALRRLIRGAGLWFLNVFAVEIVIWVESE